MKIENPPGSGNVEDVEKFEDTRELNPDAHKDQLTNDLIEKALEGKQGISESDLDRIEEIKSEIEAKTSVKREIEDITQHQPTGGEREYFPPATKKPWLKRAAMAVAFTAASMFGAKAHGENLSDSTEKSKNKIEKVVSKNNESREAVNSALRLEWNKYVDWLDSKGLKGDESLDHNNKGVEMVKQYMAEHPGTILNPEVIDDIQEEFSKYRDWCLKEIEAGRGQFSAGADKNNFMRALSIIDKIPGQRTTSFKFPESYLLTFENNKLLKTENKGFAKVGDKKTNQQQNPNVSDMAKNK